MFHSRPAAVLVAQFPGAGRGLVASAPLAYGETLFVERPMLVAPSEALSGHVCHGCLSVLTAGPLSILCSPLSGRPFCSERCMAAAERGFHALESLAMKGWGEEGRGGGGAEQARGGCCAAAAAEGDAAAAANGPDAASTAAAAASASSGGALAGTLEAFEAACAASSERFPLMAARLAFARLTAAVAASQTPQGAADMHSGADTARASAEQEGIAGDTAGVCIVAITRQG